MLHGGLLGEFAEETLGAGQVAAGNCLGEVFVYGAWRGFRGRGGRAGDTLFANDAFEGCSGFFERHLAEALLETSNVVFVFFVDVAGCRGVGVDADGHAAEGVAGTAHDVSYGPALEFAVFASCDEVVD